MRYQRKSKQIISPLKLYDNKSTLCHSNMIIKHKNDNTYEQNETNA